MIHSKRNALSSNPSSILGVTAVALFCGVVACGGKEKTTGPGDVLNSAGAGGVVPGSTGGAIGMGGSTSSIGSKTGGSTTGGTNTGAASTGGSPTGGTTTGGANTGGSTTGGSSTGGAPLVSPIPNLGGEYDCQGAAVGNASGQPPVELAGNSAEFRGLTLGSGVSSSSVLRKPIAAKFALGSNPPYTLGQAYATRSYVGSTYISHVIPITYTGVGLGCFHSASALQLQDSNGVTLLSESISFVQGSVGGDFGFYSATCLQSNETGYFLGISSAGADIFSSFAQVQLLMDTPIPAARLSTKVLPDNLCPSSSGLTMTVANQGPLAITIGSLHYYLLSDETGPVDFGFLDRVLPLSDSALVVPSGQAVLADTALLLSGRATRVRPFLKFSPPEAALDVTSEPGSLQAVGSEARAANQTRLQALEESLEQQHRRWQSLVREAATP